MAADDVAAAVPAFAPPPMRGFSSLASRYSGVLSVADEADDEPGDDAAAAAAVAVALDWPIDGADR